MFANTSSGILKSFKRNTLKSFKRIKKRILKNNFKKKDFKRKALKMGLKYFKGTIYFKITLKCFKIL
jgi:hypothetical protein